MLRTLQRRGSISRTRLRGVSRALWYLIVLVVAAIRTRSAQAQTYSLLYSFQCGMDGSNPYGGLVRDGSGNLYGTTYDGGTLGHGVVFKLVPSGSLTVLHTFAGSPTDGATPVASMVRDAAGNLYGTTGEGGAHGYGTVFEVPAAGPEIVLYSFKGGPTDGASPFPALIRDAAGDLYGATVLGGTQGSGTVFKLTPAGSENPLYSFGGFPGDGEQPHAGLLRDPAGNLYGTTRDGGIGYGTVFKLSSAGVETVLYSFAGPPSDGQNPHTSLVQDTVRNFYGTTLAGGLFNGGTVFQLTAAGKGIVLHNFPGSTGDGQRPHAGLVRDSAGNLYGTTLEGGESGYGTIFELTSTGSEVVLHSFAKDASDGGSPQNSLVRDAAGNLYGTTYYGGASGCGVVF
ncbi:MAG TPA: choice-of-anchor tandem repeat GloVer-containing protein [Terriglobia bacterium]